MQEKNGVQNSNVNKKRPDLASKAYEWSHENEIAIGESVIYPTKQKAWESIKKRAEELDYKKDEIYFNHKNVHRFNKVEQLVDQL